MCVFVCEVVILCVCVRLLFCVCLCVSVSVSNCVGPRHFKARRPRPYFFFRTTERTVNYELKL